MQRIMLKRLFVLARHNDIAHQDVDAWSAPSECHVAVDRNLHKQAWAILDEHGCDLRGLAAELEDAPLEAIEALIDEVNAEIPNPFEPQFPEGFCSYCNRGLDKSSWTRADHPEGYSFRYPGGDPEDGPACWQWHERINVCKECISEEADEDDYPFEDDPMYGDPAWLKGCLTHTIDDLFIHRPPGFPMDRDGKVIVTPFADGADLSWE